jgi:uncharacterized coiled-coil DUF342 family protein
VKKKVVKLTEKDIESLVHKIIKEDDEETYGYKSQDPKQLDLFKSEEGLNTKLDELLKNLKDKFNKHHSAIAWNATNHIGKEIRGWLKDEIGELDGLRSEIYDQIGRNIRNKDAYEKYQSLFENMSDKLELFFDEAKIKVIEELFKSKDKFFTKKREDKGQLKLDFPKRDGKETVSTPTFSFDKFDSTLEDLEDLQREAEDMMYKMGDLELEYTEEYDELDNLESSISYTLDDFQSLYNELNDAYDEFDDSEDEEEAEHLDEYIEDLEAQAMGIFRDYDELKQELDDLSKKINTMNQKPSGGKLNSDNFSGGRKRRKRHEN